MGIGLRADFLKWPHHVSMPESMTQREKSELRQFLAMVDPHTIVFSNLGARQAKAGRGGETPLQRARAFVREYLGPEFEVPWTLEEGTIQIITRRIPAAASPKAYASNTTPGE